MHPRYVERLAELRTRHLAAESNIDLAEHILALTTSTDPHRVYYGTPAHGDDVDLSIEQATPLHLSNRAVSVEIARNGAILVERSVRNDEGRWRTEVVENVTIEAAAEALNEPQKP